MADAGLVAGDAGANVVEASGQRLVGHFRIGDHCPRHAAHVGLTRRQDLFRDLRLIDPSGNEHRQPDRRAQRAGLRRHISGLHLHRRHDVDRTAETGHRSGGDVDIVECALSAEILTNGDHLAGVEPIRLDLLGRNAHADDSVAADRLAGGGEALDKESHPIFPAAAEPVGAQIGCRIEELREQEAVAGDQLDTVEPGLRKPPGSGATGGDQFLDQCDRQLSRHGVEAIVRHRRGCVGDATQSAAHAPRDPSGMRELAEDLRSVAMHRVGEPRHASNAVVGGDDQLGRVAECRLVEACRLDDDQSGAAARSRLMVGDHVV